MTNYPDLQTLFQNGMGPMAAINAGAQSSYADQDNAQALQAQQQQMQQQAAQSALEQQFKQGQITQQSAELPGIQGQAQSQAAKGQVDQQTAASNIAARISANANQIGADGMAEMGQVAQKATMVAQALTQVPDMGKVQAFTNILQKYGVDPENPMVKPILEGGKTNPSGIVPALQAMGQGMALASSDYQQRSALQAQSASSSSNLEDQRAASSLAVENARAGSNEKIAAAAAQAKVQAAQAAGQVRMSVASSKMSTDQKLAALTSIPDSEKTADDQRQINELRQQRISENQARVNPVPGQVMGMPPPVQAPYGSGVAPQGASQQGAPATVDAASVSKAFGAYEPNKYIYRINPDNGMLQRAPR